MSDIAKTRARARIVELNDQLRTTFKGGRVQMTMGVFSLDPQIRGRALCALSQYSRFAPDDDHDHGVFIFGGFAFEWQIEYRAIDGSGYSSDPADSSTTFRVLTLYVVKDLLVRGSSPC